MEKINVGYLKHSSKYSRHYLSGTDSSGKNVQEQGKTEFFHTYTTSGENTSLGQYKDSVKT